MYDTTPYAKMTLLQMLTQFHNKFGQPYDGQPRELSKPESAFRMECHLEEAQEYLDAVKDFEIVDCLDALADELYFLTGTVHRQGLGEYITTAPIALGYRDVKPHMLAQDANNMRAARHAAVLHSYEERVRRGDLIGQGMALNEAIRAFRATAQMHCFDIDEALRRVHAANMNKDIDPAKQRRSQALKEQGLDTGHGLEITKPDGWLPPYLGDLCGQGPYIEEPVYETAQQPISANHVSMDYAAPGSNSQTAGPKNLCGLITIDGPDASGKSTLAARIAELFSGQVIHLTWSKQLEAVMHDYRYHAIQYAAALAHNCVVVLERPWLSHPVYSEVYRAGEYNASDVRVWKDHTEVDSLLNIIALPADEDQWFAGYQHMCGTRVELHGPNEAKARAVYEGFRDAFSGAAGPERQPQNVEVFDMQQWEMASLDNHSIDDYIQQYVLPVLKVKG
jgi:predicted HAD superfamily Cof-like phosphohydrolase